MGGRDDPAGGGSGMRIELVGTDCPVLPGVTVGVQRAAVVLDERPSDGAEVRWVLDVGLVPGPDFTGAFVQGRRGDRFLYLVWSSGEAGMFRRAKLMLGEVPAEVLSAGEARGIRGTVRLTMADGTPLCAAGAPSGDRLVGPLSRRPTGRCGGSGRARRPGC